MIIIGIDPGIAGAICFFSEGNVIDVIDMPTMAEGKKNKRHFRKRNLFLLLIIYQVLIIFCIRLTKAVMK